MRTLVEPAHAGTVATTRMLLLPGAYNGPQDFVDAGFVRAVRERDLALDLVLVDVTLPHLTDRTLLPRLRHELVLPARAAGCHAIWFAGISLGGYIALSYAERYPGEIDGLCLLAPYLGNRSVTAEIERANGVAGWEPAELADDDEERRLWRFIKQPRAPALEWHLGFGGDDRFAPAHRLLAATLAPEAVDIVPGGHSWRVWQQLWERFLRRRFRGSAAPRAHADRPA